MGRYGVTLRFEVQADELAVKEALFGAMANPRVSPVEGTDMADIVAGALSFPAELVLSQVFGMLELDQQLSNVLAPLTVSYKNGDGIESIDLAKPSPSLPKGAPARRGVRLAGKPVQWMTLEELRAERAETLEDWQAEASGAGLDAFLSTGDLTEVSPRAQRHLDVTTELSRRPSLDAEPPPSQSPGDPQ